MLNLFFWWTLYMFVNGTWYPQGSLPTFSCGRPPSPHYLACSTCGQIVCVCHMSLGLRSSGAPFPHAEAQPVAMESSSPAPQPPNLVATQSMATTTVSEDMVAPGHSYAAPSDATPTMTMAAPTTDSPVSNSFVDEPPQPVAMGSSSSTPQPPQSMVTTGVMSYS